MDIGVLLKKKKNVKSSITKLQNKTEEEIEKLNNVGLLARKNRFLEFRNEIKDILDSIISICEEKDEETYCTEKDHILDTLEEILVAIDTQLMPFVVNSDFEVKNQGSSQGLVSARSAEVKLPTLSLPIFSGVTEEWLAFSDLFEAAVSNNKNITGAQKLQYLKGSLKSDALKIVNSLSITNDNFEIAWKLLKDRYFNKKEIMSSLIKKFINITPVSGESSTQILNLIDSTKEFVRMVESLEYMVDPTTDTLLMHMILFKLDPNSRTWFERTFSTDVIPRLDELLHFLATQARSITSSTTKRNVQRKVTLVASNAQSQYPLCNAEHTLSRCDTFLKLSVQGRSDFFKTNNVCFNCLTQFHSVKTCKSKFRCKKCKKPHHSLLHIENVRAKGRQGAVNVLNSRELSVNAPVFSPVPIACTSEPSENSRVVDVTSCISDVNPDVQILLCTALIQVRDIWGNYQTCRCLLDSGSQASLITNECIERQGLRKEKANVRISCLGASDTRINGVAEIPFTSHFSSQNSFHASVYVINKIVGMIPHLDLDSSMRELFGDISLADPAFYKSGPIDVLLGVDLTLPLLKGQEAAVAEWYRYRIVACLVTSSSPVPLKTRRVGQRCTLNLSRAETSSRWCGVVGQTLSLGKDKLFAIRSELGWIIGGKANSSGQNSFHVNHIQLISDHLINKFWELDSVSCAKPLTSLEEACEDHFVKTHSRDENGRYTVRLPFHTLTTRLVVRDTSCTTRLRVVFDASSKTSSGLSLNDLLMVGPRVQPELFPILIQFRIFSVAICADVKKMFRQINVHEEDVDWQRILWRDSPTEPIREYRLTTVTYAASRATLSHFYVDDLLSGSETKKGAIQLVSELQEMMRRGGFSLRKWVSNDPDVLATIPEELKAVDSKHTIKDEQPVKILGIAWLPDVDKFTFTITVNETDVWTKRKSPSKLGREELPHSLARQWRIFPEQLPLLTNIQIPHCILIPQAIDVQVHGFCDSSEKAYCAVIYIRSKDATQTVVSRLLTSKTRVSPVKPQSLPRLELCSALLLANLLQATLPTLTVSISETFAWSDSKITLAWLKPDPRRWQPFVANRVAQIQELTPNVHWNFVSGLENPADCGTRGIPPTKLEKCNLWFNGPDWLRSSTFPIGEFEDNPQLQEHMSAEAKRTSKLIMLNVVDATFKAEFFQKFSSWNKLKRVVAYCLRFV
ncbi:integrase catalytic domain-containing protein [Trichonephila clavipes]|uniref:Integrase catalytic domain-containing protein n=1 Tax=Trichonephila clavipes TaxID=2585209 RepID=A0A8X6UXU6_TRICX|nr:integrase catalytic domain-containing protein [Trichonephila clavipes]